jgi:hypothetical protein
LTDNVTYTGLVYKNGASTGITATASLLDNCNGHPAPRAAGDTYHYHGLPNFVTALVDTVGGPSHVNGVAADGFPIYGEKDINGATVPSRNSMLATVLPVQHLSFPTGCTTMLLPSGVTNIQLSLMCYSGVVSARQIASRQDPSSCYVPSTKLANFPIVPSLTGTNRRLINLTDASMSRRSIG